MPSINEVIERVERIKPVVNIEDIDKARWLLQLDGRIYREILLKSEPDPDGEAATPPLTWPQDGDKPLLVSPPYDNLYDLYLIAMLEFALREYGNYNNTMQAFNDSLDVFAAYHRNTHTPISHDYKNIFP